MSGHRSKSYAGKVVDTWTYEVKDLEVSLEERDEETGKQVKVKKIINKKIALEVRIHKSTEQSDEPPHPTTGVEFSVVNRELQINLVGTDIEALRAAAFAKLGEKFEVKWERYFLVKIEREKIYDGHGAGMSFSYADVYKGTTWDGKLLLRRSSWREERVEPWPGEFKDERGKVIACIPDTEANEAALDEFARRIDTLRERLADFLRPDRIEQTLASMSALKLLPPAEPTEE